MTKQLSISFGCMSDPIYDQIKKQGHDIDKETVEQIQKLSDAVNMLRLNGLLPDGAADTARRRIMKRLTKHVIVGESE